MLMVNQEAALGDRFTQSIKPMARKLKQRLFEFKNWKHKDYSSPSPKLVKDRVLYRNSIPGATWIETGTYLGETTKLLAQWGKAVFSLEPANQLYERAAALFSSQKHVTILNAASEEAFPKLLPSLTGPVNFWLDGHFSAGMTYQGDLDTPVMLELQSIAANIEKLAPVCIMIDDIRCFGSPLPEYTSYPPLDALVDWARSNHMDWHIEHDIMVIRSRNSD
jgi:hypothetical protein